MTITLNIDNIRENRTALYCMYSQQYEPQPAYVEINEQGKVTADYSGEIGNGVPFAVWHNRTLRFAVPSTVDCDTLVEYLESAECRALLDRIHAGHQVDWDGSNYVGVLTDDAKAAAEELRDTLVDMPTVEIWTPAEYLFSASKLADVWSGKSLDEIVPELERDIAQQLDPYSVLRGSVRAALLDEAEYYFEQFGDTTLEHWHVDALVADGRITEKHAQAYWAERAEDWYNETEKSDLMKFATDHGLDLTGADGQLVENWNELVIDLKTRVLSESSHA